MTRLLPPSAGVIGWPVAQSKSPVIHRFWLEKLGIDGDYGRFPVRPDQLAMAIHALSALGLRGVNVTVPHKITIMSYLDDLDDTARIMGAVNTVTVQANGGLKGANTDVDGVSESIQHLDLVGRSVVVAGTGGAARAVLRAIKLAGADKAVLLARDVKKGEAMLGEFGLAGTATPFGVPILQRDNIGLVVNATSLGMTGQPSLPLDLAQLPLAASVFDVVYSPLETPLLADARVRGMPVIDGLQMLVGQAATAFEAFFDMPAPRQHDAELRGLLVR